ncbi:DNA-directed RNA polymerase subunit beta' [Candidatus Parcubacteria bacterium]|nr:DNA-directed RNA polymerase subunit beta' [Patescibacteria group bacterium]MCG2693782.1 DNA-directed RNA polymerase subunit beta' [Candidatus Parcubacteria bacterium]
MAEIKKQFTRIRDFKAIKLKLASPEVIKSWSYGEVTKPETINYRTQKPEKGGLFAEEIFGPSKDWECYCGKYKKIRYKGIVCDKCGVEVTVALVRRERMGHIELASPVSHIWFLRGVPSKISLILDVSVQNLERVIYFASFVVTSVDSALKQATIEQVKEEFKQKKRQLENTYKKEMETIAKATEGNAGKQKELANNLGKLQEALDEKVNSLEQDFNLTIAEIKSITPLAILTEAEYHELSLRYGHIFSAGIGAESIYNLLKKVNVEEEVKKADEDLLTIQGGKRVRALRRVKLLRSLFLNGIKPEWMILTVVPVIPPDLRPMVALDGGRFATSDLNDLYRRVINRNNRLKRLYDLNAPEVISRNEKRMLQEAVDALIDNSARHTKTVVASTGKKRQLKSLADILKGKQGRFRQNLLGKRIDYSGRSVIVVGPNLLLHQCGLPKRMALELFRPFIISQLIAREIVHNIRSANRFIATGDAVIWDILEEVTKEALVLLNRAPTLHRLGIQAFQPVLIEGKAIQLHPLVCTAFNADFDGDQMAVHVPLTEEAKREARELMLASHNLLKPATGDPIAKPDKDIAWGCYYMSLLEEDGDEPKAFSSASEAKLAYHLRKLSPRKKIKVKMKFGRKEEIIETTVGRILINEVFEEKMPFVNEVMDKKKLDAIVKYYLENFGIPETAIFLDKIKVLGFYYITKSGYSWGMDDLPEVKGKGVLIEEGDRQTEEIKSQFNEGLLTQNEKHSKIIELWTKIKDEISVMAKKSLDPNGPVASMINAGARGSWGQLTQMMGMKGLLANPSGEIMELPVKKSFKDGLSVLEYFISTHGSRKGLADTALRTANAGYLTRRLVDVAQDVIIHKEDCGDTEGTVLSKEQSEIIGEPLVKRAYGRVLLSDMKNPKTGKVILKAGETIDEEGARQIEKLEIDNLHVRSVLHCLLRRGICAKCYGHDLAYSRPAQLGAAVGIIAAQSIGEPGTQLTMRTFHTGGVVAGKDITQGLPRVEELFEARPPKQRAFLAEVSGQASVDMAPKETISPEGKVINSVKAGQKSVKIHYLDDESYSYKFTKNDEPKVQEGASIGEGDLLIAKSSGGEIRSKTEGEVSFDGSKLVITRKVDKAIEYVIPSNYQLTVKDGEFVEAGDALTDGHMDLQSLYKYKGREAVEQYLLKEVKHIYFSQGQKLNDKHIEIIIRQMFSRVLIVDAGDTNVLPGEVIEMAELLDENEKVKKEKGKEATFDNLFLGITRVSLSTQSFLSAASFQETARVLINAAVTGKVDPLNGLKENVIIGRLIPAGTGFGKGSAKQSRD